MTWLITGGAGYIGAHVVSQANNSNFKTVVLDDLSTGIQSRIDCGTNLNKFSLQDVDRLNKLFNENTFEGVVHIAAKKRVGESVERPDYYWQENVVGFQNLLDAMKSNGVRNLVFSSSAAVYGEPELLNGSLIPETTSCSPINPYGKTKHECEKQSGKFASENDASVASLRYFNVAGAGRPDLGDVYIFNLIPIIFDALDRGMDPVIFGDDYPTPDGTCIRDYVHVQDLAEAHISAMNYVSNSEPGFEAINIGTGVGASVTEVIEIVSEVTGKKIEPKIASRREGDPAVLVADVARARKILGWSSNHHLRDIVSSAWEAWQLNHK